MRTSLLSKLLRLSHLRFLQNTNYSTQTVPQYLVAYIEKEDMVMCWHPELQFPYECSRPLPVVDSKESKSCLKVGEKELVEEFKHMKPEFAIEKLTALTYTTKHIWYPRARDKRAKKTMMDRPYL